MEVHLITLPNRNTDLLNLLMNSLGSGSELEFKNIGSFASEYTTNSLCSQLMMADINTSLEFSNFFDYCEWYRNDKNLSTETIVVFITDIRNNRNNDTKNPIEKTWFSAVNNNNIFVFTEIWNSILPERKVYAIAYNIMVNVFQALLQINFNKHSHNNNIIHYKPIGCLNDRCNDINDVIIKLRTGYICDTCINQARSKNISNDMIVQIYQTIKDIREKFMNFDEIQNVFIPEQLKIDTTGNFLLNEKPISLTLFQKAIYIFIVRQTEGIEISNFGQIQKNEMIEIHHTLRLNFLKAASKLVRKQDFERYNEPINNLERNNLLYHICKINERLRIIGKEKSKTYSIVNSHLKSDSGVIRSLYSIKKKEFVSNEFKIWTNE